MKRLITLFLWTALLAASSAAVAVQQGEPDQRLNVLYIVSDDLNNRLGCYGDTMVQSPNIDALSRGGVTFDRAYCQYPLCNPSRASFLAGLRPDGTGIYENATQIRKTVPDVVTLPQAFRKAGYSAARVGKLYHYGVPGQIGTSGLDDEASWDQVVNPRGRDKDDEPTIFSLVPGQFGGTLSWLAADGADDDQTDGRGALATIKLLEEYRDRPFFLAFGLYRPHTPFVAPKKYFDLYPTSKIVLPTVPADERMGRPDAAYGSAKREQDAMSDDLRRQAIQAYFASTTFMDAQVGRVLDALKRLGLDRKTVVVFHSDHGYHLGEHGLWQKMSLFEGSARVPLIIRRPGEPSAARRAGATVELVDLYPTLTELCGLPAEPRKDGTSLVPLLKNPAGGEGRAAYTQVARGGGRRGRRAMGRSVRTERYRYTVWRDGEGGAELYDYDNDPQERRNLADAAAMATVRARLQALLAKGGSVSAPASPPAQR